MKVGSRCVSMECGEQYVMMTGVQMKPLSFADNLDTQQLVSKNCLMPVIKMQGH